LHLRFYLKGKGLDTWYSAAYTELTHDQQCFTVTEVATDRQETILKSCAWQNYATVSKLTRDINQEKSSSIPSTNAENKHSVHHRICIKIRKKRKRSGIKKQLGC